MKSILSIIAIALLFVGSSLVRADDCCPSCGVKICKPSIEKTKEKKSCYEIEQKDVCIPLVNLPWKKCSTPRCGQVRTVNVLKKVDKECESCGYKWEITTVSGDGGCSTCAASRLGHGKLLGLRKSPYSFGTTGGCTTGDCAGFYYPAPQPGSSEAQPGPGAEPVKPSAEAPKPAAASIQRTRLIQAASPRKPVMFIPASRRR